MLSWNCLTSSSSSSSSTTTKRFRFYVGYTQVTRLCHTRQLHRVNGMYPGPTIAVNEGDHVEIKFTNTTIHWHWIRQMHGQMGQPTSHNAPSKVESYTHRFKVMDQRGTLLWHAHYSWQRDSRYEIDGSKPQKSLPSLNVPNLPKMADTPFSTEFSSWLRCLATARYPCRVPRSVNKRLIIAISLNLQDCPPNKTCKGYTGKQFFTSMNNHSFVRPSTSIPEHHYKSLTVSDSRSASNFPERSLESFDYTGVNPVIENMNAEFGLKVLVIPLLHGPRDSSPRHELPQQRESSDPHPRTQRLHRWAMIREL